MNKIKNILTNYLFKFMFQNYLNNVKDGDILKCDTDLFKFDKKNGNPNPLKYFIPSINGFWNYIKAKEGSVYNTSKDEFSDNICQGYKGLEYYKNGIYYATEEEIEIYNKALNNNNT